MDLRTTHKESTAEIGAHGNEGARTESRTHYINENIIFVMSNEKEQNHKVQATRKERPSGLRRRFRHNDLRRAVGWGAAKDEARKVYDAFREAGYRQWGGLMQDDVTDGVHAMIDQGIADPHRICIVGASYGGYAALAGAAFTPELYACAISINGVSDLSALLQRTIPVFRIYSTSLDQWTARIGKPGDRSLDRKSPINAVAAISAPVLIIYGTSDGVVPSDQSERMAAALSKAGKPVKLVRLPDEDHWLSRSDTRIQMLSEVEAFLREHLPVAAAP